MEITFLFDTRYEIPIATGYVIAIYQALKTAYYFTGWRREVSALTGRSGDMLKARASYPTAIYDRNNGSEAPEAEEKVSDIMARYYTKIDEIFQVEAVKQRAAAGEKPVESAERQEPRNCDGAPEALPAVPDASEYPDLMGKYRQKIDKISTAFSRLDADMKKLEDDGQLLSTVRENLQDLGRNFWDGLLEKKPAMTDRTVI